ELILLCLSLSIYLADSLLYILCFILFFFFFLFILIFLFFFFFFNDPATTEIYTLSLHDALPISDHPHQHVLRHASPDVRDGRERSEEHTSELQSPYDLVCRLLLEKKKKKKKKKKNNKKTKHKKKKTTNNKKDKSHKDKRECQTKT